MYLFVFTDVQYDIIPSLHVPTCMEVGVKAQDQSSYDAPGADGVKGFLKLRNSGHVATLRFKALMFWFIAPKPYQRRGPRS